MTADDIIEYSHSSYTSPIVAIPKKNGKVRICLDAREINMMIINNRTSPGKIEEILKKFHVTKYISTWDIVCRYWQVELHPSSKQYMAFIFDGRNYQFKRLSFGLINSVAIFVKCMDQILGQETLQFTTVYAVSYTHLDVYKRQQQYGPTSRMYKNLKNNLGRSIGRSPPKIW